MSGNLRPRNGCQFDFDEVIPRCSVSNGRTTQVQQGHGHIENTAMCMKISTVRTLEWQSDLK